MTDLANGFRMVGIGRTKGYSEVNAGRIRTVRVGRRRLVTRQALLDYLDLLTQEAEGGADRG